MGLLLWLGGTVIDLMSGESSWRGIAADPREVMDDLTYYLTAGLLIGAVMFLIERQRWNGDALTDRADPPNGKARFLVENTFPVTSRGVFVVQGSILGGVVHPGQRVKAPAGIDAPVDAIELVLVSATETRDVPGLTFRYRDAAELARWQALDLKGQALELEPPTAPGNR